MFLWWSAASELHVLMDRSVAYIEEAFSSVLCSGSSLPRNSPPSFHCFNSVTGACSSYCLGAHGWIARICQPWEQSSSTAVGAGCQ